ncbi:glycolipid sulfotransferase [Actinoplanes sp. SE50]|uniref:sulfotransferase domain-containing protein n=1 Tax=unclassified Actinoplanes TaxID=2626549 RepID=UPI00023EC2EB|nr:MULTISPECIES: sulfotransferase domain-containing protein [unclassified Actinoplanes]AEV85811.1 glycolipid sulfotransferase [Actinoplanes sp. SE50/110]ATO84205.1 glycolipid sulfotransferase [Actinoplanes sp. SE50]SLM01615.1 glycolipid sulfotransferase [Actinoplanes sp. SE50/110]
MGTTLPVYRAGLNDSTRWERFEPRTGDIVISAPSKCGTTWLQMICALLILQEPALPAPLTTLSPWLDIRLRPIGDVTATLAAQRHRRFIKTHTPLDGLPRWPGVTYLVIGRDPRDVGVSIDHHRANLDGTVFERLLGGGAAPRRPASRRERILQWMHDERPPTVGMDTLRTMVHHLGQAWECRADPSVVLLHYAELSADLPGQMRALAGHLALDVPERSWPALVGAAGFDAMRGNAARLVPDERLGLFTSETAFFRSGRSGQWRDVLTDDDLAAYDSVLRSVAAPGFVEWLQR